MKNYNLLTLFVVITIVVTISTVGTLGTFNTPPDSSGKQSDGIKILGHLEIVAKDNSGNIKEYGQTDNIVTTVGKSCVAVRLFGGNGSQSTGDNTACGGSTLTTKFTWIGIGTSNTVETTGDTALTVPFGNRGLGAAGLINNTGVYNTIQRQFVANSSGTIQEAGLFDASTFGHMFSHKTFSGISLNNGDTLTVTWRITYS